MRKICFLLLFFVVNTVVGQIISKSVIEAEKYFLNPKLYISKINTNNIQSRFLIDYVLCEEYLYQYNGKSLVRNCYVDEWKNIFSDIHNSSIDLIDFMDITKVEKIYESFVTSNIYPIVNLHMNYNKITQESIENGDFIIGTDFLIDNNSNKNSYSDNILFSSSVLRKYIYGDVINFILPKGLWFDNTGDSIIKIEIDFEDGIGFQEVYFDTPISIEYQSESEEKLIKIRLETQKSNSNFIDTLYSHFTFYRKGTSLIPPPSNLNSNNQLKSEHPIENKSLYYYPEGVKQIIEHVYYNNVCSVVCLNEVLGQCLLWWTKCEQVPYTYKIVSYSGREIEYCFYMNPQNTSGKLRRPFIVCDGFDPGNTKNYHSNNSDIDPRGMYEILNGNPSQNEDDPERPSAELVSKLQALGYDIVFVNFLEGAGDIPSNAESLRGFLNDIINKEYRDENTEEIILVGPSMAGLITRYALAKMEENKEEHYVRQWISFDSPQKGANVAIGIQWAVYYLSQMNHLHLGGGLEKGVEKFKDFAGVLDTKAAQQMLLQHYSNFGSENNAKSNFKESSNKEIGPHQNFIDFYTKIEALNNNEGYPSNVKRYAITNGGTSKRWEEEGAQIIKFKLTNWTYVRVYANHNKVGTYENFWGKRQDNPFGEGNNDNDYQLYTANQIGYENAPGGGYVMTKILNQNEKNIALEYFDKNLPQYTAFTFMPTSTTFGVKVTRENVYKTWKNFLANETPFDEIFGMVEKNEDHVQITSKTADDILIRDILKDDFNNCIFPYNRAGKQIIKTISNNVMYKAEQTITFAGYGNNCIVKSGAITHVKASNKITFLPGFKVEQGAHLHASIEPIAMNQASLLKSDNSQTNTINCLVSPRC